MDCSAGGLIDKDYTCYIRRISWSDDYERRKERRKKTWIIRYSRSVFLEEKSKVPGSRFVLENS
jgi:hypothetical protein